MDITNYLFMTCFSTDLTAACMSYCPTMETHLLCVRSNVANIKHVCDFTLVGSNSVIISDSCDYIGSLICILVEVCFPHIFKLDLVHFYCTCILLILYSNWNSFPPSTITLLDNGYILSHDSSTWLDTKSTCAEGTVSAAKSVIMAAYK